MDPQLVDRIYECSFLPELWPGVLAELAKTADARGGVLVTMNPTVGIMRWTASESIHDLVAAFVSGGWIMRGQRFATVTGSPHAGFMTEHSSEEGLRAQPMYRDFLLPHGLGWSAGTGIPLPTGDFLLLSMERDYSRGRVEPEVLDQLDALRPHLARSALLSARLQLERARAVSEALSLLGLPALVFDSRGVVLAANPLIEAQPAHLRWRARDRVSLKDLAADALFNEAIATLGVEDGARVRSFAVRDAEANAALVAHVIPIRRTARDIFTRSAGVLVLTPLTLPHAPPVELVQSLFRSHPGRGPRGAPPRRRRYGR